MRKDSTEALNRLAGKGIFGHAFFDVAAESLSLGLGCRWAAIASLERDSESVKLLSLATDGSCDKTYAYELDGTPCFEIYRTHSYEGHLFVGDGIIEMFPRDAMLSQLGAQSYRGQIFFDAQGAHAGHVFVMDDEPMIDDPADRVFFNLVTQRVGSEYNRWCTEQELQMSRARLEHAANLATLGYYEWNEEGDEDRAIYCSDQMARIYGYETGEELRARMTSMGGAARLRHPDDRDWYVTLAEKSYREKVPYETECRILTRSGAIRHIREVAVPKLDQEGNVVRTSGVVMDITREKQVEAGLREAKEIAEKATGAKSRFLANISHELRTPLNAIIGITEMLQDDARRDGDDQFEEPLDRIRRAGTHLLHLIDDVLDLSKIEAGRFELHPETVDLSELMDDLAMTVRPLAERNDNRLVVDCPGDVGNMIADPLRVRQIMLNLLSNACKFTENGEIRMAVNRVHEGEHDCIRFVVSDTGVGIDVDDTENLFQEFTQVEELSRRFGGTGLGLAISQRLCRLMNGRIDVESTVGVGSTFTVLLPA